MARAGYITAKARASSMINLPNAVTSGVRGALSVFAMAGIVLRDVLGCFLAARTAETPLGSQLARTRRMIASVYVHLFLLRFTNLCSPLRCEPFRVGTFSTTAGHLQ